MRAAVIAIAIFSMHASHAEDRVAAARTRAEPALHAAFQKAGVAYPPASLFLRAFKREGELELWTLGDRKFVKVATFPILAASGGPGPKRKEGDEQVPEGFYELNRFNPKSRFHLSLGLNYPNDADRILGDAQRPGTDIFIHGNDVTIGCLPMGDEMIEQIYLAAKDTVNKPVRVHIFPARMSGEAWAKWRDAEVAKVPTLAAFWEQLQPGYDHFEKHRTLPEVTVGPDGTYRVGSR